MSAVSTDPKTAEERFRETYITAPEVCEFMEVSRVALLNARRRGLLPHPIEINGQIFIWERAPLKPYLDAWKLILNVRRGNAA